MQVKWLINVLAVERNDVLTRLFIEIPYVNVVRTMTIREGVEIAKEKGIDIVAIEDFSGVEECIRLFKTGKSKRALVIIFSFGKNLESRVRSYENGADEFFEYPFDSYEVLLRIKKLLPTLGVVRMLVSNVKYSETILLDCKRNQLIYNICKLQLSRMETKILYLIMEHNSFVSTTSIKKSLGLLEGKKYTDNNIRVILSRLRLKMKKRIGIELIRCKYKDGYYLDM